MQVLDAERFVKLPTASLEFPGEALLPKIEEAGGNYDLAMAPKWQASAEPG
jgi:hypothetical protein